MTLVGAHGRDCDCIECNLIRDEEEQERAAKKKADDAEHDLGGEG